MNMQLRSIVAEEPREAIPEPESRGFRWKVIGVLALAVVVAGAIRQGATARG